MSVLQMANEQHARNTAAIATTGADAAPEYAPSAETTPPEVAKTAFQLDVQTCASVLTIAVVPWIVLTLAPLIRTDDMLFIYVLAGIAFLLTVICWTLAAIRKVRIGPIWALCMTLIIVVVAAQLALSARDFFKEDDGMKLQFASQAGAFAIGALMLGWLFFGDVKGAVSLAVAVLFIVLAVHPQASAIPDDIRKELIRWMGVIIGATAVAEGVEKGLAKVKQ